MSEASLKDRRKLGAAWIQNAVIRRYGREIGPIGLAVYAYWASCASGTEATVSVNQCAEQIGSTWKTVRDHFEKLMSPMSDGTVLARKVGTAPRARRGGSPLTVIELLDVPEPARASVENSQTGPAPSVENAHTGPHAPPCESPDPSVENPHTGETQCGAAPDCSVENPQTLEGSGSSQSKNPPYPPQAGGIGDADFYASDPGAITVVDDMADPADPRSFPADPEPEVGHPGPLTDAELRRFALDATQRGELAALLKFDPAWPEFARVERRMLTHFKSLPVQGYHLRKGCTELDESWKRYLAGRKRWEELGKDELEHIRAEAIRKQRQFEQREADRKKREAEQRAAQTEPGAFRRANPAAYDKIFGPSRKAREFLATLRGPLVLGCLIIAAQFEADEREHEELSRREAEDWDEAQNDTAAAVGE